MNTIAGTGSAGTQAPMRGPRTGGLIGLGVATVVLNAAAAAVAVSQRWPAAFGVTPDPDHIAQNWLTSGTAISAPLAPIVALAAFIALANARSRRAQVVGFLGSLIVGVLFVIGQLGEPTLMRPESPLEATFHVVGLVLALILIATAGAGLTRRRSS
jgi:uncharacterized BrkB/YihY/UPF0761 family membrane protein